MQDSRKYDKISVTINIFDNLWKITQFNVEIGKICQIICEEGSESKIGSEEGFNVFRTLHPIVNFIIFMDRVH